MRTDLFVICFLVGAFSKFDLPLDARVPVGELLAFMSIPFLLSPSLIRQQVDLGSKSKFVLWILLLWIGGVVLSDAVSGNSLSQFARGLLKPIFVALWMLFCLGILTRDPKALLALPAGEVLAAIQNYLLPTAWTAEFINSESNYEVIAYGIAPIITSFGIAAAIFRYGKPGVNEVVVCILVSLALGYIGAPRSLAGIFLAAAILFQFMRKRGSMAARTRQSARSKVAIGVVLVVGSYLIYELYVYSAGAGWLGVAQQEKLYLQSQNAFGLTPLGLLLGGRPQFLAAILAILDSPIVGYGSWASLQMPDYFFDAARMVGVDETQMQIMMEGGATYLGIGHSIILVAWLENSVLAMASMILIVYATWKVFSRTINAGGDLAPYLLIIVLSLGWDLLFSPFATWARFWIGLILAVHVSKPNAFFEEKYLAIRVPVRASVAHQGVRR